MRFEVHEKRFRGADSFHSYRHVYDVQRYVAEMPPIRETAQIDLDLCDLSLRDRRDLVFRFNVERQRIFGTPIYFIERGLLDAVVRSSLPAAIDWETMHLPFEAASFILPRNTGLRLFGKEVARLEYCRLPVGQTNVFYALFFDADNACAAASPANPFPVSDGAKTPADIANGATLVQTIFTILFAMAARPEYVETGKRLGRHRKSGMDIWSPNVVGRKYATKNNPSVSNGSHSSPKMHWRAGHFRLQPFGPGRGEYKSIWIDPMLISGPETSY